MRPGRLNLTVEILRDSGGTQGAFGEHVEAWTVVDTRRAHIAAARGVERFKDENERAEQLVTITLRYDTLTRTLTPRDRLRYTQDVLSYEYDVRDVVDLDGLHRWILVNAFVRWPEVARVAP